MGYYKRTHKRITDVFLTTVTNAASKTASGKY